MQPGKGGTCQRRRWWGVAAAASCGRTDAHSAAPARGRRGIAPATRPDARRPAGRATSQRLAARRFRRRRRANHGNYRRHRRRRGPGHRRALLATTLLSSSGSGTAANRSSTPTQRTSTPAPTSTAAEPSASAGPTPTASPTAAPPSAAPPEYGSSDDQANPTRDVPAGIRPGCELEATRGWQVVAATSCSANASPWGHVRALPEPRRPRRRLGRHPVRVRLRRRVGRLRQRLVPGGCLGLRRQDPGQVCLLRP